MYQYKWQLIKLLVMEYFDSDSAGKEITRCVEMKFRPETKDASKGAKANGV